VQSTKREALEAAADVVLQAAGAAATAAGCCSDGRARPLGAAVAGGAQMWGAAPVAECDCWGRCSSGSSSVQWIFFLVFIDLLHLLERQEWQFLSPTAEQAVHHGLGDAKDDTQYKFLSH